jgi:hypothetical protein
MHVGDLGDHHGFWLLKKFGRHSDDAFIVLPRLRGRIQEGASIRPGVGQFQIGMISSMSASSLRLSPSCILPRVTGEDLRALGHGNFNDVVSA